MISILAETVVVNVCSDEQMSTGGYWILGIMLVGAFSLLGAMVWDVIRH